MSSAAILAQDLSFNAATCPATSVPCFLEYHETEECSASFASKLNRAVVAVAVAAETRAAEGAVRHCAASKWTVSTLPKIVNAAAAARRHASRFGPSTPREPLGRKRSRWRHCVTHVTSTWRRITWAKQPKSMWHTQRRPRARQPF